MKMRTVLLIFTILLLSLLTSCADGKSAGNKTIAPAITAAETGTYAELSDDTGASEPYDGGGEIYTEPAAPEPNPLAADDGADANLHVDDKSPTSVDIYTLPAQDNSVVTHIVDHATVLHVTDDVMTAMCTGTPCSYDGSQNGMIYIVKLYSQYNTLTYTFSGNYIMCDNDTVWHKLTDADAAALCGLLDNLT